MRGGTPVLPFSAKTFKMRALTDMARLSSAVFDDLDLEQETGAIGQQRLSYLAQGNDLRSRLCSWVEEMAENSWDNVAYLGGLQARTEVASNTGA